MTLAKLSELQDEAGGAEQLMGLLEEMGDDGIQLLRILLKVQTAQRFDDIRGFEAFFNVCYGLPMLPHTRKIVSGLFNSRDKGRGRLTKAHRDSAKTTLITQAYVAFQLGHNPDLSWLIIQAGDEIASENADAVANLIANNQGWHLIFPHVRPWSKPKGRGWSEKGYWLIDMRKEKAWATLIGTRKDPSLVGLTWNSDVMVGRRPTGGIVFDDVHNEKNSESEVLMAKVLKTVQETIMPMLTQDPSNLKDGKARKTQKLPVGTPWTEGDILDWFEGLSNFDTTTVPLFKDDFVPEGTPGAVYFNPPNPPGAVARWIVPNWPEKFDIDYIHEKYEEVGGEAGFVRQYLLDPSKSSERIFRWQDYPHEKILSASWPVFIGVDPAFLAEDANKLAAYKSEFAMCFSAFTPEEILVPFGGVNIRCTPSEGVKYILEARRLFKSLMGIWVETDGVGIVFYDMLRNQHPELRGIIKKASSEGKGKLQRHLEADIPAWMNHGRIKISDDPNNTFLAALRKQLKAAPNWKRTDCADALYYSAFGARHRLRLPLEPDEWPKARRERRKPKPRPFSKVGSYRGTS